MEDQASKLREKSENQKLIKPGSRVIAVTSGKGGVGKTNFVTNLGICLTKKGKQVTILDADLGMANVDVLMGLAPKHSLYEVLGGEKTIDEVVVTAPSGVKLIPGGSGFNEIVYMSSVEKQQIEEGLGEYAEQQDFFLIDTGAGLSKDVLTFVSAADEVIVVVTPEPTSIADAYAIIKVIWHFNLNSHIHLVVNMAGSQAEAGQASEKIIKVATHFLGGNINKLGFILDDDCVARSVREQVPFFLQYPTCTASEDIRGIAEALVTGGTYKNDKEEGFISKLMRFFS